MVQAAVWGLAVGYAVATLLCCFVAMTLATAMVRRVRTVL